MFQNSKNHLASYACIKVSGFIFLCDACCSLQTKIREFLLCYSYKQESDWMDIQPIEGKGRGVVRGVTLANSITMAITLFK